MKNFKNEILYKILITNDIFFKAQLTLVKRYSKAFQLNSNQSKQNFLIYLLLFKYFCFNFTIQFQEYKNLNNSFLFIFLT